MRVLVINADCLTRNSSANLCHLSYIRGLIENGFEVDVLSADGKDYQLDPAMVIPKEVTNYTIYGVSLYEKASIIKSRQAGHVAEENQMKGNNTDHVGFAKFNVSLKRIILSLYGPHGIYRTFIRKAMTFSSSNRYDLLLSISTPPASHLLAYKLLKKGNLEQYLTLNKIKKEKRKLPVKKLLSIIAGFVGIIIISKIPMNEPMAIITSCAFTAGSMLAVIHYSEVGRMLKEIIDTPKEKITDEQEDNLSDQFEKELINEPMKKRENFELSTKDNLIEFRNSLLTLDEELSNESKQKTIKKKLF